jgi:hypothetical protein
MSPVHTYTSVAFGNFQFRHDPLPGNPEHVRVIGGWDVANLTTARVPQLKDRTVCLNHKVMSSFLQLMAAWEAAGLLPLVHSFDGGYASRFKRQNGSIAERLAKCALLGASSLSNHCLGSAFDINASELPLGQAISPTHPFRALVPVALRLGWSWGGDFKSRPDPMHFERAF